MANILNNTTGLQQILEALQTKATPGGGSGESGSGTRYVCTVNLEAENGTLYVMYTKTDRTGMRNPTANMVMVASGTSKTIDVVGGTALGISYVGAINPAYSGSIPGCDCSLDDYYWESYFALLTPSGENATWDITAYDDD